MNAAPVIPSIDETRTFVDVLLEEQRALTAVERFSRLHDHGNFNARERQYRSLLPSSAPGPGQQYAFEVDLDKCSGCKACVTACHSLNGLDETETWRSVGLLISKPEARMPNAERVLKVELRDSNLGVRNSEFGIQHVTTACHHCVDPGCLNGCPVLAYDKDPVTGIVRHLDDQCIGCSYCVMKCPYDVPKFSKRLGIVRKCDMCSNRLEVGEAPACAQACPNEAIKIAVVGNGGQRSDGEIELWSVNTQASITPSLRHASAAFPDPSITQPTTRFVTRRSNVVEMAAADVTELRPATAHPPLSLMLVLTQLGVGAIGGAILVDPHSRLLAWLALGTTLVGVNAATLHLGQPLKAWRGFLGWRRSWLSRELLAFGGVMGAMSAHALLLRPETAWAALLAGVAAVFCSAMIYVDTHRAFWSARITFPKFALTTILMGSASALMYGVATESVRVMVGAAIALIATALAKLGSEIGLVARYSTVGEATRLSSNEEETHDSGTATDALTSRATKSALHPGGVPEGSRGLSLNDTPGSGHPYDALHPEGTPDGSEPAIESVAPSGRKGIVSLDPWFSSTAPVLRKTALLHTCMFRSWFVARFALGVTGGVLLPALLLTGVAPATLPVAVIALVACLAGEVIERHLFFVCEAAPRMPGGPAL